MTLMSTFYETIDLYNNLINTGMKKGDLSIERKGKHRSEDNGERTLVV